MSVCFSQGPVGSEREPDGCGSRVTDPSLCNTNLRVALQSHKLISSAKNDAYLQFCNGSLHAESQTPSHEKSPVKQATGPAQLKAVGLSNLEDTSDKSSGRLGNGSSGTSSGHGGSQGSGRISSSSGQGSSVFSYGREKRCRLEIVALPRYCCTSGPVLCSPPLIVRLRAERSPPSSASDEALTSSFDLEQPAELSLAQEDVPFLVASVSVWSFDGLRQLMPAVTESVNESSAEPALLAGQLVVHGQRLVDTSGQQHIFFVFPKFQFKRVGSWRLGVSLLGLWPTLNQATGFHGEGGNSSSERGPGSLLATVVADRQTLAIDEENVEELAAAASAQLDEMRESGLQTLLTEFRLQGVDLSGSELSSEASD